MLCQIRIIKCVPKNRRFGKLFLQFAKDFGCSELTQKSEYKDKIILDDEYYENKIMPIMTDFEELATYESLSNELAWRDFREKHSEEEIKEMEKRMADILESSYMIMRKILE